METRTLVNRDGFGIVDRIDEATACAGGNPYCPIIDDASVYFKVTPLEAFNRIYDEAVTDRANYPSFPPGRIASFYRIFVISRKYKAYAGRPPRVGEIIDILSIVDEAVRGLDRQDDYQLTDILVRWKLDKKLSANEQPIVRRLTAGSAAGGAGGAAKGGSSPVPLILAGAALILLLRRNR